jgi:lipoprotein-anchoring transpeptidase ErfK/SrfK
VSGRRRGAALGVAVGVAAACAAAAAWPGGGSSSPARPAPAPRGLVAPDLAEAPAGALPIGRPVPLRADPDETRWAPVRHAAVARAAPRDGARAVAPVPARTPEGTTNLVVPVARAVDRRGRLWLRVRLATLPNGLTGWVPRRALGGYGTVDTRLVVDRRTLRATLLRDGRAVLRVPVGVGTAAAPTPPGTFYVRDRLTRYSSPAYGPVAFGTSARSPTLTDWPAGGYVGIHGTDRPDLLPGRVSHGCIRMRNADVLRLARLMPVGTPLKIR